MTQIRTDEYTNNVGFKAINENNWIKIEDISNIDSDSLIWIKNKNESRKNLIIRALTVKENIELYFHNGWEKFQIAVKFYDSEPETERQAELIKIYEEEYQELVIGIKKNATYTCSDGIEFEDPEEANKHQSIVIKVFNLMKNQHIEGGKEAFDAVFKLVVAGLID